MMNTGPIASMMASAIRAVTSTPTVATKSSSAPSQRIMAGVKLPETAPEPAPCALCPLSVATSAMALKIVSIRSAKICVAEPLLPVSTEAIWSGAPTARFHTTL